jgi:hypothetical protein
MVSLLRMAYNSAVNPALTLIKVPELQLLAELYNCTLFVLPTEPGLLDVVLIATVPALPLATK